MTRKQKNEVDHLRIIGVCLWTSNYDSSEAQTPPLLLGCLPHEVVE